MPVIMIDFTGRAAAGAAAWSSWFAHWVYNEQLIGGQQENTDGHMKATVKRKTRR